MLSVVKFFVIFFMDAHTSHETIAAGFALIGVMALFSQWIAWRVKLPAILFLLLSGFFLGPITGLLEPDKIFGDILFPLVSLSVAIILFEGALTLKMDEIRELQAVVQRLVTTGALITWLLAAVIAHEVMGFSWQVALLFGTLVSVTGPTVIVPMLRTVRPKQNIGNILRWEGIVIDPIGALLAVLVYEIIASADHHVHWFSAMGLFAKIIFFGVVLGWVAGYINGWLIRHQKIPDYLQTTITLTIVIAIFVLSNYLAHESGLLAVTVMGFVMANMKDVKTSEILHFKENLSVLLISGLFIILAARIEFSQIIELGWAAVILLAIIQFVIRPIVIWTCSIGSSLTWQEKTLLSWMGPRGIVAAAISALFANKMVQHGYADAEYLVPLVFIVIIGTVILQSATARPLAKLLGVAEPDAHGYLLVGANPLAREIAKVIKEQGYRVLLTDSSRYNIRQARIEGLEVFYGNVTSSHADQQLDLSGIGNLLGLSMLSDQNALACMRYRPEFGENHLYSLQPSGDHNHDKHQVAQDHRGYTLFGDGMHYNKLASLLAKGGEIRVTNITEEFSFNKYLRQEERSITPLFAIDVKGNLQFFVNDEDVKPEAGWQVASIVSEVVSV